jgi:replication-associated recombination protein RarA
MRAPLSELLRPKEFRDLIQPLEIIQRLEAMVKDAAPANMLLYGSPGLGKTSAARILLSKLGGNCVELNGSLSTGIDVVRDITRYASSVGVLEGPRICFIDEADYLSVNAQAGLLGVIERHAGNCRFLLTANDIRKFQPALKSRCMPICFDIRSSDAEDAITRLLPRYAKRLEELGFKIDGSRLKELLSIYFPDLRAFANRVEFEATIPKAA